MVNELKKVTTLDSFASQEDFEFISYHRNGNIFTLVSQNAKNKELILIDYNLDSGKLLSTKQALKTPYDHLFRLMDKTLLVNFDKKRDVLCVKSIQASNQSESIEITIPKEKQALFKKLSDTKPETINQNEFVQNGSIADWKSYYMDHSIVYTFAKNTRETEVFVFDLSVKNDFQHQTIANDFSKDTKDSSNYLYDNKLSIIGTEKENITLKIFDLKTASLIQSLSLKDFSAIDANALKEYLKSISKSSMKPTLTINKTHQDKLAFRIAQVNERDYSYNYNWYFDFWFMRQQMWHSQQMMNTRMSVPRGFGPSPYGGETIALPESINLNGKALEFVLEPDFKTLNTEKQDLVYTYVDRKHFLDIFKDNRNVKQLTAEFITGEMRYIYFDSATKVVQISALTIYQ